MKSKWNPSGVLITENLLDANERIAAMEAELATLRAELVEANEIIESLEAEVQPWRRMELELEALRGAGWVVFLLEHDLTSDGKYHGYVLASDRPFPAAVAAAYEQVVGDA